MWKVRGLARLFDSKYSDSKFDLSFSKSVLTRSDPLGGGGFNRSRAVRQARQRRTRKREGGKGKREERRGKREQGREKREKGTQ